MPKISAPTVAEHREQRRADLLTAATSLILRGRAFTVAEVATEVGLSRSAVYEYYSGAGDLVADVLVDELTDWADHLREATAHHVEPADVVDAWVVAVLGYVADGRHALVRAAASIELPPTRRAEVQALHRELIAPLHEALVAMDASEPGRLSTYVWGVVDAAINRIESGSCSADAESAAVLNFVRGGLERI